MSEKHFFWFFVMFSNNVGLYLLEENTLLFWVGGDLKCIHNYTLYNKLCRSLKQNGLRYLSQDEAKSCFLTLISATEP